MNKTIKSFLESELYHEFTLHFCLSIPLLDEIRMSEIERLKDRLTQRQILLDGVDCTLHSEDSLVAWYTTLIKENNADIFTWIDAFWKHSNSTQEDNPDGEFAEGEGLGQNEKSKVISMGKVQRSCFAMYMIEFEILKNHSEILAEYYKKIRIPASAKYAKEMIKLYSKTFAKCLS